MFTIFDTSALGKPKKWNLPASDSFNWPRMIHLTWASYNDDYSMVEEKSYIIKPEGFEIDPEVERFHGITHDEAMKEGHDLSKVLEEFAAVVTKSEYLISHNLRFNENIVGAEYFRKALHHNLFRSERFCLMMEATYFCKIPNPKKAGYKWPSLPELFERIYGKRFKNSNHALADLRATAMCFIALKKNNKLDDLFDE